MPSSNAPAPPKALDQKSQKAAVPKEIHYIWIGGTIASKYAKGIKKTAEACPSFQVNLWLSEEMSFKPRDYAANVEAATEAGAAVRSIDDLVTSKYTPTEKWAQKLEWGWKDGKDGAKKPNFGAVSDIIRAVLLMVEGGIYIDTDCGVNKSLDKFKCKVPFGFQAATGSDQSPNGTMPSNCVMISIKDGLFIGAYRQWINDKYGALWNAGHKKAKLNKIFRGEEGYNNNHVEGKTLLMTGPSALTACGMGKLTVGGDDICQKFYLGGCTGKLEDFAVNKKHFNIAYDNTWLDKKKAVATKKIKKKTAVIVTT